jgi:lipopolysaccharide/colanic/teichoic acid biosynthesis glycosyltransferase
MNQETTLHEAAKPPPAAPPCATHGLARSHLPDGPCGSPQAGTFENADLASGPLIAIEADPLARRDHPLAAACYRVFEVCLAAVAMLAALPVMLAVAAVVRLDSPGPALFFQTRCGRSRLMRGADLLGRTDVRPVAGRFDPDKLYHVPTTFRFVKFRTMHDDARVRFPHLYLHQYSTLEAFHAGHYKLQDDPRVTRAGRFLRKTTLDELPNFWNVITGKVALVGPRPETANFLAYYSAEEMLKFTVRPGITGLAQISGRSNLTIGEVLAWDLRYVRERSISLDFRVIFVTAWLVLIQRGAF